MKALEKELLTKNEAIEELRKEKQLKAEETVKAQMVRSILFFIHTFAESLYHTFIKCNMVIKNDKFYDRNWLHYQKSPPNNTKVTKER